MRHDELDPATAMPLGPGRITPAHPNSTANPGAMRQRNVRRGRRNHQSGLAAEAAVARHYDFRGATVLGQRVRTPEGELDLIVRSDDVLVFVEVKKRSRRDLCDSPVSRKQWARLEKAALHYMVSVQDETGVQPVCRFDVALMAPDGSIDVIENARSFDEQ